MSAPSDAELLCCSQEKLTKLVVCEGSSVSKMMIALCFGPARSCFGVGYV